MRVSTRQGDLRSEPRMSKKRSYNAAFKLKVVELEFHLVAAAFIQGKRLFCPHPFRSWQVFDGGIFSRVVTFRTNKYNLNYPN